MVLSPGPVIEHSLAVWFTVNEEENRVLLCLIEVPRFDHPRVHLNTIPDVDFQELGRFVNQTAGMFANLIVRFQDAH